MAKTCFLCTMPQGRTEPYCRLAVITDDGYVNGETPVEDFGMYFMLDFELGITATPDQAFNIFLALMEGDTNWLESEHEKLIYKILQDSEPHLG
jgi:hypothetical protein